MRPTSLVLIDQLGGRDIPKLPRPQACGAKNALVKDVPAKSGAEASDESIIKKDPSAEAPAAGTVDSAKAKAKAVGIPPESEPSPLKDGIDAGGGNVAGESSPMKSFAKVGIVPADDGRITLVISESVSPSLLGAKVRRALARIVIIHLSRL